MGTVLGVMGTVLVTQSRRQKDGFSGPSSLLVSHENRPHDSLTSPFHSVAIKTRQARDLAD